MSTRLNVLCYSSQYTHDLLYLSRNNHESASPLSPYLISQLVSFNWSAWRFTVSPDVRSFQGELLRRPSCYNYYVRLVSQDFSWGTVAGCRNLTKVNQPAKVSSPSRLSVPLSANNLLKLPILNQIFYYHFSVSFFYWLTISAVAILNEMKNSLTMIANLLSSSSHYECVKILFLQSSFS